VPTVSPFTNINYTLSLSSDPLTGPYTTTVSIPPGTLITVKLNQWTAGPISNVSVSFGDGTPLQNYNISADSCVNITKNYTIAGTYTITATPVAVGLNVNITVNTMSVYVLPSKSLFFVLIHNI
jgi:hypothetical protein